MQSEYIRIIFRLNGGRQNAYRASIGKPEWRKTPRRSRQRWKSNTVGTA